MDEGVPSLIRGIFSTTKRGFKPKRVKGKES